MKRPSFAVPVSLFVSVVLIFVGASAQADPMSGADERENPQTAVVLRGSDFVVVDESSPAVSQVGESRFFPTGVIDQSTTVILVDGDFERISTRLGESEVSRDDILSLLKDSRRVNRRNHPEPPGVTSPIRECGVKDIGVTTSSEWTIPQGVTTALM